MAGFADVVSSSRMPSEAHTEIYRNLLCYGNIARQERELERLVIRGPFK